MNKEPIIIEREIELCHNNITKHPDSGIDRFKAEVLIDFCPPFDLSAVPIKKLIELYIALKDINDNFYSEVTLFFGIYADIELKEFEIKSCLGNGFSEILKEFKCGCEKIEYFNSKGKCYQEIASNAVKKWLPLIMERLKNE